MAADPATEPHGTLRQPGLARIMGNRKLAGVATVAVLLQVGLTLLGLPALECPVPRLTGSHCPGCGLTRSVEALLRGDFEASMRFHAFGPVALLGFLLVAAAAFAPREVGRRLTQTVRRIELVTGLTGVVLLAMIAYWLFRLVAGHGRVESLA